MNRNMPNLDEVKRQLEERLKDLGVKIEDLEGDLRAPLSADWEEQATQTEGDEVLAALENSALAEASKIQSALQRIDNGTYGECGTCGGAIDKKRMEALPYATQCIECAKAD